MEHAVRFTRRRRTCVSTSGGKKRNGRLITRDENRNAFPHSVVAVFEPEDIDVPICRTFNILDRERDVIESFQLKHYGQSNCSSLLKKAKFSGARHSIARTIPVPREIDLAKARARSCVRTHA